MNDVTREALEAAKKADHSYSCNRERADMADASAAQPEQKEPT